MAAVHRALVAAFTPEIPRINLYSMHTGISYVLMPSSHQQVHRRDWCLETRAQNVELVAAEQKLGYMWCDVW